MKLHLPKSLLTAVLAAAIAPAAWGLTVTGVSGTEFQLGSTALTNVTGFRNGGTYTFSYDGAGTISGLNMDSTYLTYKFDIDLDAAAGATNIADKNTTDTSYLIYVSNGSTQWGLRLYDGEYTESSTTYPADGTPEIVGHWNDNDLMYKQDSNAATLAELGYTADGGDTQTATVTAQLGDANPRGVVLYKGTETTDANKVYGEAGLLTVTDTMTSVKFNTAYVSNFVMADTYSSVQVSNASETWTKTFDADKVTNATTGQVTLTGGDSGTAKDQSTPIVVGGAGQLKLEAYRTGNIVLDDDLYIGSSTYNKNAYDNAADYGVIRISNDDPDYNYSTELSGNIYLVEDSSIKGTDKDSIILSGKITDKGVPTTDGTVAGDYTLTLGGAGIEVSGTMDLGGLKVVQGYSSGFEYFAGEVTISSSDAQVARLEVGTNAKLTIAEGGSLKIGSTIKNSGSLVINGTIALGTSDLEAFDRVRYSEGGTANGVYTYGFAYQLVSDSSQLSGSTTQITYNDATYSIAEGIKIAEGSAYVVASDTVQVGGTSAAADTKDAGKFVVLKDATLQLNAREADAALTADALITTTEGEGIIDLRTKATLAHASAPIFEGTLKIGTGGVLQVGSSNFSDDVTGDWSVDLTNLAGIELAGGKLRFRGGNQTIEAIKVSAASTLDVWDMKNKDGNNLAWRLLSIGTLNLEKQLNLANTWKSNVAIDTLKGNGKLSIEAGANNGSGDTIQVAIKNMDSYSGTIGVVGKETDGSVYTTVTMGTTANMGNKFGSASYEVEYAKLVLNGAGGIDANTAANAQQIGDLTLGKNATVEMIDGSYNFKTITVEKNSVATIHSQWDKNQFIGALLGEGELTLKRVRQTGYSAHNNAALYNLDGTSEATNFSGVIKLHNNASDNQSGLIVRGDTTGEKLQKAVIDFTGDYKAAFAFAKEDFAVVKHAAFVAPTADKLLDGAVAGLKGNNGNVYAAALTINTADSKSYDFGGNLTVDTLVKDGAGTQTLSGSSNTFTNGVEVKAGKLVAATGAALGKGGTTTISGGSLEVTDAGATITKRTDATSVQIALNGEGSADSAYAITNAGYSMSDARLEMKATEDKTINNRLLGVDLVNKGTGTVTAVNGYNNYTSILAESGNIHVKGYNAESAQGELSALTIGANLIVGVHDTWNGMNITTTTNEGTLTIAQNGTAGFGEGAQLYANLKLSSGVTLTLDGALTMGSTLTLSEGMTLKGAMLTSVSGLTEGNTVNLFESVDSLILGDATYDANNALAEGTVSLNQYFTNVTNESIYLAFNNGNVFAGIMSIPEPTTATLSLLALAGLAARRRRASR